MTDRPEAPPRRKRGRPAHGRDTPLERDEILDRASAIIRSEGLDALSMRRLGKDLGVTPMSIYHHIPDKSALLHALIERVWDVVAANFPQPGENLVDFVVAVAVNTRTAWLDNIELAPLAVAVAPVDDRLLFAVIASARTFRAAGFPDVPRAYNAVQTFTMGSVMLAASRRTASSYFRRDPHAMLVAARRALRRRKAPADEMGVLEARFDVGDDKHFEPALRDLIAGLLADQR